MEANGTQPFWRKDVEHGVCGVAAAPHSRHLVLRYNEVSHAVPDWCELCCTAVVTIDTLVTIARRRCVLEARVLVGLEGEFVEGCSVGLIVFRPLHAWGTQQ